MKKTIILLIIISFLTGSCSQPENGLPVTKPENEGLSTVRLNRISIVMQRYVDENKLPGLITMVARHGKIVHYEKYGMMDTDKPMEFNTIFSIQSMTKPVTSVAVMMLYEEGRFQLSDPVSKFIPEFKDLKVFKSRDKDGIHVEDQLRPMTIRDLLLHTSGLGYGWGNSPVDSIYNASDIRNGDLKEMVRKLSGIPLYYQPGTRWNYSVSTDVLGYLVEVLSGKPFDVFLKERLFAPLKMSDTDFSIPGEKTDRVAALYGPAENGGIRIISRPDTSWMTRPAKFFGGGGRLFSTASDYMIFSQMLLNKGEYNGTRILGSKTVDYMTENHLTNEISSLADSGMGFGLGFGITCDIKKAQITGSDGSYGWSGAYSTFFQIDPKEQMITILMTQFSPNYSYQTNEEFLVLTYQAIVD